jgi:outer membrane lipoprotein-sorting protein
MGVFLSHRCSAGVAFVACILTILSLAITCVASPRPTPPREIIAQIYNPVERNRLAHIRSFILSGTATLGQQHGTVTTYWKAPNKFVIVTKYTDERESYAVGFDGNTGWFAYPSGVFFKLSPIHEKANDCSGIWLSNPDWFPQRWPTEVRYAGWTMIQSAPAILLDVSFKMCGTDRYAFDAKTNRPIFQNLRWDGRAWLDRNAPAVRGQYRLTFQAIHLDTVSGSSVRGAIWYHSVRVNVPLDDAMFRCPPVGGRSCTSFRT